MNKNKAVWDIVNLETNKTGNTEETDTLKIDGNIIRDQQAIANIFSKYFLTLAKNINKKQNTPSYQITNNTTPLHYLLQSFK